MSKQQLKPRKLQEGLVKTIIDIATECNGYIFTDTCKTVCGSDQSAYKVISKIKARGYGEVIKHKDFRYLNIKPAGFKAINKEIPKDRSKNKTTRIIRGCRIAETRCNALMSGAQHEIVKDNEAMYGSRMHGVISCNDKHFMAYNYGPYNIIFNNRVEMRTKSLVCKRYDIRDIPAIVFADSYNICAALLSNEKSHNESVLTYATKFEHIYVVLNGKAGIEILRYIYDIPDSIVKEKIKNIKKKYSLNDEIGIGDGSTDQGDIYNMVTMELWKLRFLAVRKNEKKIIICTKAEAEYLKTITNGTFEII